MDNFVRKATRQPEAATSAQVDRQAQPARPTQPQRKAPHKSSRPKLLIGLAILAALLLLGALVWAWFENREPTPQSDRYQAVFLNDGKVFFGRLKKVTGEYAVLENAYYTQSQQNSSDGEASLQPTGVNLVKVGEEIYGPENGMAIRTDQIQFWQDLTTDNQIVKAIEARKD